jgi:penicillin-binding protein 2
MKQEKIYEDLYPLLRRAKFVFFLVAIFFIFLILNFWKVQILDHDEYWKKSEANRMREIALPYQRGLILDRQGIILANNRASFRVSLIRENCEDYDKSCRKIARLLNIEEHVLKERIKKYESQPLFKPIVIKENLTFKEVAMIEARKLELPELILQSEPKRFYPFTSLAAHVIGYLQELSPEDIRRDVYGERRLGELVGKTGMEKQYEDFLVGGHGRLLEVVDSLGRGREEVARREPEKGQDLMITLDFDLQKEAEKLLEGREGAIIAMDPRNGEILALASYPNFDPNRFINRFTSEEWLDIVNSPEFPLENRAIRGLYSPGSVFKLTMALGALDLGIAAEDTTFVCKGETRIYNHPFSCWREEGHGKISFFDAIRDSCNIYFYNLGKEMGIDEIAHYARKVGFGSRTGIDLPGEKEGLVPDPEWKIDARDEPWQLGETISVSIGQSFMLVTPIQISAHTALIANRGIRITPHLFKSLSFNGEKIENGFTSPGNKMVNIETSVFDQVIQGMWEAVNKQGTGWAAIISGFDVCGKTGSTQVISEDKSEEPEEELEAEEEEKEEVKTHSWFTGFAPRENPEIVVTVIVEYGGMGGETAAPLARRLFNSFRKKYDRQEPTQTH